MVNMKSKYSIILILLLLGSASCKKYLDKAPDEDLNINDVFTNRLYAEQWLTNIYSQLPPDDELSNYEGQPFTGASDEMEHSYAWVMSTDLNNGSWGRFLSRGWGGSERFWTWPYQVIRKVNIFLSNINKVPLSHDFTEQQRARWKAEARFLRAFYYFRMFSMYGPVPIMDTVITPNDNYLNFHRRPVEEVVNYILKECDEAAPDLEWKSASQDIGRATRAACLALKARTLLYVASPLYNGNPDYKDFQYEGQRMFIADFKQERWKQAADAAKACIDQLEANGYGLYKAANGDPMKSYQDLFIAAWNEETIFAMNRGRLGLWPVCTTPNGYAGGTVSIYGATQNIVDAYEMANGEAPVLGYNADGTPIINPASGYQEDGYAATASPKGYWPAGVRNMYVDREPRFYASINFNGQKWRDRGIEFWNTGKDGFSHNKTEYTKTGYLIRKYADPAADVARGQFPNLRVWIYFRLGEQYLNYAEALNEADGPVADVYKYVNAIRDRAGLPALPAGLSQQQMREKIWHERRVELAFETARYFDCRRWKVAADVFNAPVYGMNVQAGTSLKDDVFYKRMQIEKRVFENPKMYFWPILQTEYDKSEANLFQTPNW